MKRRLSALLLVALLAGCSSTITGTNPGSSYPLKSQAVPSAGVAISSPEPGPGRKVGIIAASSSDAVFYQDAFSDSTTGVSYSRIFKKDKVTGKVDMLRQTKNDSLILQMFTDEEGNLYYVVMTYTQQDDAGNYLYKYNAGGDDELICDQVSSVIRIDNQYIYFYRYLSDQDVLYGYSMKDKTTAPVTNTGDIFGWNDGCARVSWNVSEKETTFTIVDTSNRGVKTVNLSKDMVNLGNGEKGEAFGCAQGNTLVVFAIDFAADKSTIYRIDIAQGTVMSKQQIDGSIGGCTEIYQNKIYFYASKCPDETLINQAIYSYDIAGNTLRVLKKYKDSSDCEMTYHVEIESGQLYIFTEQIADGPFYDYQQMIAIE